MWQRSKNLGRALADNPLEELAFLLIAPALLMAVLAYAGVPTLYWLLPGLAVEFGHFWNQGYLQRPYHDAATERFLERERG